MTFKLLKQKGFWLTLLTSILIILVAIVTDRRMDLFVPETGKYRLFGGLGIIFALTLIFKWKFSRYALGLITVLYIIPTIILGLHSGYRLIFFVIILILLISILILLMSRPVNDYVNG